MQPVKPAPHAQHPLAVLDVQRAHHLAQAGNVAQVARKQGQQVVPHLGGHVGQQGHQALGQAVQIGLGQVGHRQRGTQVAVNDQGFFIGFKAAHQRIHRVVLGTEQHPHLGPDFKGVGHGILGAVMEPGTAAPLVAFGIVVRDHDQRLPPGVDDGSHVIHQRLAQVGPAQAEHAPQVAKGLDDALGRLGGNGDVDAPVHALHHPDGRGVVGPVTLAIQPRLGAGVVGGVALGQIKQPGDAFGNGPLVRNHGRPPVCFSPALRPRPAPRT